MANYVDEANELRVDSKMTVENLFDFLDDLPGHCDGFRVRFCLPSGRIRIEAGCDWIDDGDDLILGVDDEDGYVYTVGRLIHRLKFSLSVCNRVFVYDGVRYYRPTNRRAYIDWKRRRVEVWLYEVYL